ncbi:nucleotide exchange factor GrpE [Kribbella pratensis]|uniref:Molecular chaperone GrpE n=1 Tax=Kribbella pratensis TaxID=2512112 RepID=A0A4V3GFC1_9ACTN|nr:nucleotide exchange factor GrpE [Kribbella pratensis]TDW66189.1 molecular chaperone GrpE [Kribbella pratensis]
METTTGVSELTEEVAGLRDLFRRRLLNDKVQQQAVDELTKRLNQADRRAALAMVTPVLRQLVLVLDRIGEPDQDDERVIAIRDELAEILTRCGVTPLGFTTGLAFDPGFHHAVARVEVDDARLDNRVVAEIRPGYLIDGLLLRPAEVRVGWLSLTTRCPQGAGPEEGNINNGGETDGARTEVF